MSPIRITTPEEITRLRQIQGQIASLLVEARGLLHGRNRENAERTWIRKIRNALRSTPRLKGSVLSLEGHVDRIEEWGGRAPQDEWAYHADGEPYDPIKEEFYVDRDGKPLPSLKRD